LAFLGKLCSDDRAALSADGSNGAH
jgi:hypothetical protein